MNEKTELASQLNVIPSNLDINLAVEQFQKTKEIMESLGIESATFKTGVIYQTSQSETVLANDGILVTETENITIVAYRHEGSNSKDAMMDLKELSINQKALGAFSGRSQSWVSCNVNKDDE